MFLKVQERWSHKLECENLTDAKALVTVKEIKSNESSELIRDTDNGF